MWTEDFLVSDLLNEWHDLRVWISVEMSYIGLLGYSYIDIDVLKVWYDQIVGPKENVGRPNIIVVNLTLSYKHFSK